MDKLQLAGQNLGVLFNSRSSSVNAKQINFGFEMKLPNLKLKLSVQATRFSPVRCHPP